LSLCKKKASSKCDNEKSAQGLFLHPGKKKATQASKKAVNLSKKGGKSPSTFTSKRKKGANFSGASRLVILQALRFNPRPLKPLPFLHTRPELLPLKTKHVHSAA
jgi:hypothetical protein